jgi:hypothetical protein
MAPFEMLYGHRCQTTLFWSETRERKIFGPDILQEDCDRTTSEMRGLSPKIILGDSRRSENAQTHTNKHTIPNMKFKLKLLQIKCHVLGFTKVKAPKCASKDNQSFCKSVCLSR